MEEVMDPIMLIGTTLKLIEFLAEKAKKGEKVTKEEWQAELEAGQIPFDDLGEEG
jgi:hypothetical protein